MANHTLLYGCATPEVTQRFLQDRFSNWHYQSGWQKPLSSNVMSSLLGIEFKTMDIPYIQQNLAQLLTMGCNHYQWHITEPEELAFVHQSPFFQYFHDASPALVSRHGVIFSLRLPPLSVRDLPQIIEQASAKMKLEQWDRILLTPERSFLKNLFTSDQSPGLEHEQMLSLNVTEDKSCQEFIRSFGENIHHLQIPFNLVQFKNFLQRRWQLEEKAYALPELLKMWKSSISFRSPFSIEHNNQSGNLLVEYVKDHANYPQAIQTMLVFLKAREKKINQDLKKWQQHQMEPCDLEPFMFMEHLEEACHTIQNVEGWEQYISTLWFPPFQHLVRSWSLKIPDTYQDQWRWLINDLMEHIHEIMGLQSEALHAQQAQRMLPFLQIMDQYFPEMPVSMTFGAKTLLLLASTPWPETVLFPWKTLDSTVEYLGLMRFSLLTNAGFILKELSKIDIPAAGGHSS